MRFKKFALLLFLIAIAVNGISAQPIPSYYQRAVFLQAPPGSFQNGLLGFVNPAISNLVNKFESRFLWATDGTQFNSIKDWGIFTSLSGLSFGVLRQKFGDQKVTDYKLSLAGGNKAAAWGLGYGWSTGDQNAFGRERLLSLGTIFRPNRYFSLGVVGNFSVESNAREGILEAAVRPFGTPNLALFADAALQKNQSLSDAPWSVGAAVKVFSGLNITGRYLESEAFTIGLSLNFGYSGVSAQAHFDDSHDYSFNSYGLRMGAFSENMITSYLRKNRTYVEMHLKGRVDYLKYRLFDQNTVRFMDLLEGIQAATTDKRVAVLALNLSGMHILPEHAWEIREELKKARQAGKKVIVFFDNAEMTEYHLASVADYLMMDPEGILMLPGYLMGRTFLKGTLDKLGLAFDEWRFFKYKSAAEVLSRDKMSDADRQQRQDYVDDWYEQVRGDITQGRPISPETFDEYVDNQVIFLPQDALKMGLVDTLARWDNLKQIIRKVSGDYKKRLSAQSLRDNWLLHTEWGEPPTVAVVYGLGVCAMDEGIKARQLEKVFRRLKENRYVKAVVFRVDSPGGDGLASDVVAEALKSCAEVKPVIVSQGQVAGSGGYWISMYADTIVAGATTITGSIGVIGGWLYDAGFSEKLGMTSDHVQKGAHADLGFGVQLPFLGATVPARNLTVEEREKVEDLFLRFYRDFVSKVAAGRKLTVEEVEQVAQGHFYSGIQGKRLRLVDEIGGLTSAIEIARKAAKIPAERKIRILEIPEYKGLLRVGPFSPPSVALLGSNSSVLQFIQFFAHRQGKPLPLMKPGSYPELE